MIEEIDADGSGTIDMDEFLDLMQRKNNEDDIEEQLVEAFQIFDEDRSGTITKNEIKTVMDNL